MKGGSCKLDDVPVGEKDARRGYCKLGAGRLSFQMPAGRVGVKCSVGEKGGTVMSKFWLGLRTAYGGGVNGGEIVKIRKVRKNKAFHSTVKRRNILRSGSVCSGFRARQKRANTNHGEKTGNKTCLRNLRTEFFHHCLVEVWGRKPGGGGGGGAQGGEWFKYPVFGGGLFVPDKVRDEKGNQSGGRARGDLSKIRGGASVMVCCRGLGIP